jgi:hypothetical protein
LILCESFPTPTLAKDSASVRYLIFGYFLCLIKESNQRKSRKNNASPRKKAITHPAILLGSRTWYLFNDDLLAMKSLLFYV